MATNYTIKKAISVIKSELKSQYPDSEILSFTSIIFEYLLNYSRTQLLNSQNKEIPDETYQKIITIIEELKSNKPIQYILGETSFYDLKMKVTPDVLIPRQETEELVDWVIKENKTSPVKVLDIGTGSGCIAISLAHFLPQSIVFACDISDNALAVAKNNCSLNNVTVNFLELDILNPSMSFNEKLDIIISNPPYVTLKEKDLMQKNVLDYEPELALFVPNNDPLVFYKAITEFASTHLNQNGKLYFEMNETYGNELIKYLKQTQFQNVVLAKDINGKDRMLRASFK